MVPETIRGPRAGPRAGPSKPRACSGQISKTTIINSRLTNIEIEGGYKLTTTTRRVSLAAFRVDNDL